MYAAKLLAKFSMKTVAPKILNSDYFNTAIDIIVREIAFMVQELFIRSIILKFRIVLLKCIRHERSLATFKFTDFNICLECMNNMKGRCLCIGLDNYALINIIGQQLV